MQPRWRARSRASACTAMLATLAGGMTAVGPAAAMASTCQSWVAAQPPSPGSSSNHLNGVTVISPCDAWAVGSYTSSGSSREQNLVEHWNGASWKVVPSPQPGTGGSFLVGVRGVSASNIWAVGAYFNTAGDIDLILHWNGHRWQQVASPSPGVSPRLTAVRAVSANHAWAVGTSESNTVSRTIILHWNGRKWTRVKRPNPGVETTCSVWPPRQPATPGQMRVLINEQPGPDPHPALERPQMGPGQESQPRHPGGIPRVGSRDFRPRRLGGWRIRQWLGPGPDPHPALERSRLGPRGKPEPRRFHERRCPGRRGRHLRQQRVGGR